METKLFTKSKSSITDLEKALNNRLSNLAVKFVGAEINYGNNYNRASILLHIPTDGQGQVCQVKMWTNQSSDTLSTKITDFLQNEDKFGECVPIDLSLVYADGKWRVMLVFYTSGGTQDVNAYRVLAVADNKADDFNDQIETELDSGSQPLLYAYTYGNDKHRSVAIYV